MFSGKTLLITGGTGSFGNAMVRRFLETPISEIRIFSRDEKKQDDMRKHYGNKKLKFYVGDVRDPSSISDVMCGVDYVFHAAALKQVPSCEFFPLEAMKTNVIGTANVIDCAVKHEVEKLICLSTDKAVYPINAMGITKALMEKVVVAKARDLKSEKTKICCTRYGNVMASRGSVIPLFIEQIKKFKPITITNPAMTRFMMSLSQAVELVLFAFDHGENGDIFVQKSPAATIDVIAKAVSNVLGQPNHEIRYIGTRHGEKLYEVLVTSEEMIKAIDMGNYYRLPIDNRDLNYDAYYDYGDKKVDRSTEYNSHNTHRLSVEELRKTLVNLEEIQEELQEIVTN